MSIAVFNVERTLLRGNSLLLAAKKSNSFINIIWLSIKFIPWIIAWKMEFINRKKIKELFIDRFKICQRYNLEAKNNNQDWLTNDLKQNISLQALNRLRLHQKKGDIVILCSATPDMILEPLAKELNADLICTNLLKVDNKWVPKIEGENCNGEEKLKRIMTKYGSLENKNLEVYVNSKGDKEISNAAFIPHYGDFSDKIKIILHYQLAQ